MSLIVTSIKALVSLEIGFVTFVKSGVCPIIINNDYGCY